MFTGPVLSVDEDEQAREDVGEGARAAQGPEEYREEGQVSQPAKPSFLQEAARITAGFLLEWNCFAKHDGGR